jgi:predicted nucleic acid-binding protein
VLVEYLAGFERGEAVRARILADAARCGPRISRCRGRHVLRRAVARGDVAPDAAVLDLARFPLRRVAHVGLLDRAWALRANVSFYDALYVALAERLDEPLLTLDARLATARGVSATIVFVA